MKQAVFGLLLLVAAWWRELLAVGPPDPPAWVAQLPLIGERASAYWGSMAHDTALRITLVITFRFVPGTAGDGSGLCMNVL